MSTKNKKARIHENPSQNASTNKNTLHAIEFPIPNRKKYGFYEEDGRYKTEHKNGSFSISNFRMKSLYHLIDGSNNTTRIVCLSRKKSSTKKEEEEERFLLEIASSELNLNEFEKIAKSHRCTFLGNTLNFKQVCEFLMDNEEDAIKLETLGYNKVYNVYVFADSIINRENEIKYIDDFGIIKDAGQTFYLPSFSYTRLNNAEYARERLYAFRPGNLNFAQWSNLFYRAYGINGGIGIQFTILSLFREVVFNYVNFFPFLFLFGDWGTGKSSYVKTLLNLIGKDSKGTSLKNSTSTALSRLVNQRVNSIFYFTEYTNKIDERTENFILTAYDGSGRNIGLSTTDNRTKSFDVSSAVIFDGNELPSTNAAMFSRMISLSFEKKSFSDEEIIAFKRLEAETFYGFGNVLKEIVSHREHFRKNFKANFDKVFEELRKLQVSKDNEEINNLSERSLKHIALILTPYKTLNDRLRFPYSYDELFKNTVDYTIEQDQMITETKQTTVFWQAMEYFSSHSNSQDIKKHYKIEFDGQSTGTIFIKYRSLYPYYIKYCRENGINNYAEKNSLLALLTSRENKAFIPGNQKGRGKNGKAYTKHGFGSCYRFKFNYSAEYKEFEIGNVKLSLEF